MTVPVRTCENLREAAQVLAREKGSRFLAGGTLLIRAVNEGDQSIRALVVANDPALSEIRPAGSRVQIGAGVTMAGVLASRELAFLHPAARGVGGPAVRNMATVGGNLFARSPYGDFAVALLALDATVSVQSGYSPREMPLEQFLASSERTNGALVGSVQVRRPATPDDFRFRKVTRVRPKGMSVLSIAMDIRRSAGRLSNVRVAYGAMGATPIRAKAVERALEGRSLEPAAIDAAVAVATDGCAPMTDPIATDWYRREVLPVHLRRLLLDVDA